MRKLFIARRSYRSSSGEPVHASSPRTGVRTGSSHGSEIENRLEPVCKLGLRAAAWVGIIGLARTAVRTGSNRFESCVFL